MSLLGEEQAAVTGAITDVGGIRVGHHHRLCADATLGSGWATGSTVVLTPPGTVGAVDVRGGAPGTRETDLLDPANSVRYVDAVLLTGGSAFGLAAADGVMQWLEENDRGVVMDGGLVPIVPAAVIFDLPVGGWQCRPTAEFGYAAAAGAGTDVAGRHRRRRDRCPCRGAQGRCRDGVGHARVRCDGGGAGGGERGRQRDRPRHRPAVAGAPDRGVRTDRAAGRPDRRLRRRRNAEFSPLNTTIAVVATDAALSPAACRRVAIAAHDGLARTIRPSHTPLDGDTVFALATGAVEVAAGHDDAGRDVARDPLTTAVGAAAADCLARAVLVGVLAAEAVAGIPTYRGHVAGSVRELMGAGEGAGDS